MAGVLQNLRAKPDKTKTKIALAAAAGVTLLIVGAWFVFVRDHDKNSDRGMTTTDDLQPLFSIFKSAKTDWSEIKSDSKASQSSSQGSVVQ